MNAKSLGTVVLLTFVAVSIGYLVISESRTVDVVDEPEPAPTTSASKPRAGGAGSSNDEQAATVGDAVPQDAGAKATQPAHKVIAYYFHNTQRCMTCNKIERLAEDALREQFAAALEEGQLEWRTVNMEDPLNAHFVQDYQLVASSLVLVDLHNGAQRDWTNMKKVWQYVHDDEAKFKQYVAEQTRKYLESES